VNNRDLHTFDVSLETTVRLARVVPVGRLLVAESGIRDHDDVKRLARAGVDAVLVGESLLRREDIATAVSALAHPVPVKPRRPDGVPETEEVR
jgi:indole-3-glycerol phosphate synthase